jgi:hypothetical protein
LWSFFLESDKHLYPLVTRAITLLVRGWLHTSHGTSSQIRGKENCTGSTAFYPRRLLAGHSLLRQEAFLERSIPKLSHGEDQGKALRRWLVIDERIKQKHIIGQRRQERSSDPRIGLRLLGLQLTRVSWAYVSLSLSLS